MRDLTSALSSSKRKSPHLLDNMPLDNHTDSPPHTPLSISDNTYEFPESVLPSCFRNVSSCSRCRLRKTRCDQRLPRCQSCEKVGERCVGYDPITKREIPRSYVYFLECRVNYLKRVLIDNNISFKPASAFDEEVMCAVSDLNTGENELAFDKGDRRDKEDVHLIKTADNCPDVDGKDMRPRSFLPGLFPWKASKCDSPRNTSSMLHTATSTTGGTIFESLSSFQSGPNVNSPEILDRELAERLINFYFEYASPQFPVLNKNDFMEVFNRTYSVSVGDRSPRSLYFLYIVFAIGAGIVFDDRRPAKGHGSPSRSAKRRKLSSMCDAQPKDYYVSAIKHLESSLDSSDRLGTLEELQAVVLLAHFSLLQPVAPGPAHMVELAMRTSLDLRLYCEDAPADLMTDSRPLWETAAHEDGMRNLRRRLWWCVYSLDRLVCPYTGRPFSISDQIITTELPSFLESSSVTRTGVFSDSPTLEPITAHYFRLRLLQSEIHQGLQFQRAQRVRQSDKRSFTRMCGSSSFLHDFDSFGSWRKDINHRLDEWKASIPAQNESGSSIPVVLLELDYWQTINQLYRQSLNVPVELVEMLPPGNDIRGSIEEDAEWEDLIYLKVAESSQKVLQIYRLMHHVRLVNYTYLATHSIFLAGSLFLFTIWDSPLIRSQIALNEIDYTLLAGTTVLADMMDKYSHAEACRDSLERMGIATVQMCLTTTDFGSRVEKSRSILPTDLVSPNTPSDIPILDVEGWQNPAQPPTRTDKPIPQFDMNLERIFSECIPNRRPRDPPSYVKSKQNTQFPPLHQQTYHEPLFPKVPPSLYHTSMQSMSPISTDTSTCHDPPHPMISLDFFEFDFGDMNPSASGESEQDRDGKVDGSLGSPAGKRGGSNGFGIAVDPEEELGGRENYDFLDAFLVSN